MKICVYCASSDKVADRYFAVADALGQHIACGGHSLVYGGGSKGLMGRIADAVLAHGGKVRGVLPRFMDEVEWGHEGLTEMVLVDGMHERKRLLVEGVDAAVALPGGCGTLEELAELISLKKLGKFTKPIIIVNVDGFYDALQLMLDRMVEEHFMRPEHRQMYTFVRSADEVIPAILSAPAWSHEAISFAAI